MNGIHVHTQANNTSSRKATKRQGNKVTNQKLIWKCCWRVQDEYESLCDDLSVFEDSMTPLPLNQNMENNPFYSYKPISIYQSVLSYNLAKKIRRIHGFFLLVVNRER